MEIDNYTNRCEKCVYAHYGEDELPCNKCKYACLSGSEEFKKRKSRFVPAVANDPREEEPTEEPKSIRQRTLEKTIDCVCGHRVTDYGKPEDSFGQIAAFWNAYLGMDRGITALDVCNMMALLKMARIMTGTATEDSFVDLAGYAACGAEIAAKKKE